MAYAYDYEDEDEIMGSYSQQELDNRDDYMLMIEGETDELFNDGIDFDATDPRIIERMIGTSIPDYQTAFIKYMKRIVQIFFTVDPLDLSTIATDVLDHYMNTHRLEPLPFDPRSGRSVSDYMSMVREIDELKPYLFSEESEEPPTELPTKPSEFHKKIHNYIKEYKLSKKRIFQLDWMIHTFTVPKKIIENEEEEEKEEEGKEAEKVKFSLDYTSFQVCSNAEGESFCTNVERNYDLNKDTFKEFLNKLKKYAKPSKRNPILVLMCRKLNTLTMELLYDCEDDGILLCAFPAYCKNLEPLSRHVIPSIKERFDSEMKNKLAEDEDSAQIAENVEELMGSIITQVQKGNVHQLKHDFSECLQLNVLNTQEMDVDGEGVGNHNGNNKNNSNHHHNNKPRRNSSRKSSSRSKASREKL